jgi:hypothetical protein
VSEAIEPVEEAVASYLEFVELGGKAPDFSRLDAPTRSRVEEMIGMLELTEGMSLRTARPEDARGPETAFAQHRTAKQLMESSTSEPERELLSRLDAALPPAAPVDSDHAPSGFAFKDLPVLAGWTVGTVGGRVRVWLIDVATAGELEQDVSHLENLDRVFRAFPETAAICLACRDLTCLLLEPQDCAPVIEVPAGSFKSRRYRRPIQPVAEALTDFIRELIPAWEALPRFEAGTTQALDVAALAGQAASDSVHLQKSAGARARYPKKEVLGSLDVAEIRAITDMAIALYEGRRSAAEVDAELRKLAEAP